MPEPRARGLDEGSAPASSAPAGAAPASSTPPTPPPQDAVAAVSGTFADEVGKVKFVDFVDDLITGVFQSIVDATTTQMQAFATLVEATALSTSDYATAHVSDADANSFLQMSMPNLLSFGDDGGLGLTDGADPTQLLSQLGGMGISGVDPSSSTLSRDLVDQARLKLAAQRQQMLATMVLMGINRIIVTDGEINAKVVFQVTGKTTSTSTNAQTGKSVTGSVNVGNSESYVTLWTGQNYTGACQKFLPGDYDLDKVVIGNDTVQSIQIPDGWRVTLYQDWHFSGNVLNLDSSQPTLPQSFTNVMSGLRIYGFVTSGSDQDITIRTVDTAGTQKSDDWISATAALTGEVGLRFKSESFPLGKFAQDLQDDIQSKASKDHGDTVV